MSAADRTAPQLPHLPPEVIAIDSHCHLHDRAYDEDRAQVLQRAEAAGVRVLIEIGASDGVEGNQRALRLTEQHPGVFATVGIHPHDAKEATPAVLSSLEALASHPRVVAIGETGLDYHYNHSPREQQQDLFRYFVHLARRAALPLTVHLREADDDALMILRSEQAQEVGGVIHCFTGDWATARQLLDLGFFLSFSGVVTFKNAEALREVARKVPRDRFLLETDSPYLAPVPRRGRRNEPAFVLYTAACVAEVRKESLEEVVQQATENTTRCFPRIRLPETKPALKAPDAPRGNGIAKSD